MQYQNWIPTCTFITIKRIAYPAAVSLSLPTIQDISGTIQVRPVPFAPASFIMAKKAEALCP